MSVAEPTPSAAGEPTRYILLTQCLQNDFLLNRECRLFIPDNMTRAMLLGAKTKFAANPGGRLLVGAEELEKGPLGRFLAATIGDGLSENGRRRRPIHVINIRDWHTPTASYDLERRAYGSHCEEGTWGAEYVEGLKHYLDPSGAPRGQRARFFSNDAVRIYHIHSDSVFDFRPRSDEIRGTTTKFWASPLENILDVLIQGSDDDVDQLATILGGNEDGRDVRDLARQASERGADDHAARVYIAVIGVYTDIKVVTLLAGLRTRYDLPNLAVSDSLTASVSLERHISGLDFADKILDVEVIHSLNTLIGYLGGNPSIENEAELLSSDSFSRYRAFFREKQNLLSYQTEKLQDYLALSERRAVGVYDSVRRTNEFLRLWGLAFLVATLVLTVLSAIGWPRHIDWKLPLVTGGLSLLQLIYGVYSKPIDDLQENLTNLMVFKMVLESHSLKNAFTRFHLTTPQTLREVQTAAEAEAAKRQIELLKNELAVMSRFDKLDFDALERLGFNLADYALPSRGRRLRSPVRARQRAENAGRGQPDAGPQPGDVPATARTDGQSGADPG